jgi:hypothetical protein
MEALKLKAHVGHDGILRLDVPVGVADVDCEIVVTVPSTMTAEEWNQFVDRTAGSLAHDPIERLPQGEYEQREPMQ